MCFVRAAIYASTNRAGEHAQRVEVMLADPGRVHADLVGIQRLSRDVGDELVRRPRVVLVVIVAQREIAEVHAAPPVCPMVTFSWLQTL